MAAMRAMAAAAFRSARAGVHDTAKHLATLA